MISNGPITKLLPTFLKASNEQFETQLADVKDKLQKRAYVISNLDQYTRQDFQPSQDQQHSFKVVNMISCNLKKIVPNFDANSSS